VQSNKSNILSTNPLSKFIFLIAALAVCAGALSGCGHDAAATASSPPGSSAPAVVQDPTKFALTPDEQQLYDKYKQGGYNPSVFKNASQNVVAKVYIECGVLADSDGEYNLYSKNGLTVSEDEYRAYNEQDVARGGATDGPYSRQTMADANFLGVGSAKFVNDTDTIGHLEFTTKAGDTLKLYMYKEKSDLWLMKFQPTLSPFDSAPAGAPGPSASISVQG